MATWQHKLRDVGRGLPALSPLALALLVVKPGRVRLFLADCWRGYRHYAGRRIPAITPWELLEFDGIVNLRLGENGLYAAMEPNFLIMQIAAMLQPEQIFEIGTNQGRMTALIAMNTPESTRIFTLDLPPGEAMPDGVTDVHLVELAKSDLGVAFRETSWREKISQLLGNSATFDFGPYTDAMDLVLVDGSHSYSFVLSDTINAFRMVRPGGVILWHDYESLRSEYGVTTVVNRLRSKYGMPTYRLSRDRGDTRFAVMRVSAEDKAKGIALAENPESF